MISFLDNILQVLESLSLKLIKENLKPLNLLHRLYKSPLKFIVNKILIIDTY
jgi:hypothetical protein